MAKPIDPFDECQNLLAKYGDNRVWSVIATMFGDLASKPGDSISGPLMSRILARLEIKPQAMRVALHRLRQDGWIESRKDGRIGTYWLSDEGHTQTAAARHRIFPQQIKHEDRWHVAVPGPMPAAIKKKLGRSLVGRGYLPISNGAFLAKGPPPIDLVECFLMQGEAPDFPDWLKDQIAPKELYDAYLHLEETLKTVALILRNGGKLSLIEIAALRTLIVHKWRFLVLRSPSLPEAFFPQTWAEPACRELVFQLLSKLERPNLNQLEVEIS